MEGFVVLFDYPKGNVLVKKKSHEACCNLCSLSAACARQALMSSTVSSGKS
jgi:positive regulator of sigma E activity